MRHTLLLFLSAGHLHAQFMSGKNITAQHEFVDSPEGHEKFAAILESAKCPTYLLVDLIEEDFRQESVPHLSGSVRTTQLLRKFEQFYRGTPFHQATLLQRQTSGRRDDDMLFSALTNPALLTPWLNTLLAKRTPLVGIYSVPQISAPLVKDHPSKHLLLISWEKSAGLRQTYFSDHRLQISRLTPIHNGVLFQDAVVTELSRTYQYLKSLSLLPSGQPLDVRLLGHSQDLTELQTRFPEGANIRYEYVDLEYLAKQLKIDSPFTDSDASQIFLHQLVSKPPVASYANASHVHHYQLWQLRRVLNLCSATLLLVSLLWGAADIWQSKQGQAETESLKTQQHLIAEATKQISATFPKTDASALDMKTAVATMHKLDQYSPTPNEVLVPVSTLLERFPRIWLSQLTWQMSSSEPVAAGTRADVPAQAISIEGHLGNFDYNYRAALEYLDQFQQDLMRQGYQIRTVKKPLDTSPAGSLSDQQRENDGNLDFSLKISWRPPA